MRTCVYTAVIGGYDALLEQRVKADSDAEFICFTTDPSLESDTWEIVPIAPLFEADPVRSARHLKILGHPSLTDFDATLWIDATVQLRMAPERLLAEWLRGEYDLAIPLHSFRESVLDEFDEVDVLGRDQPERLYEQLLHYAEVDPESLQEKPLWTGMIARREGVPEVRAAMELWFWHVLRYSRRDQLSLRHVLRRSSVRGNFFPLDNFDSAYQSWPHNENRHGRQGMTSHRSGPLLAEWQRARREARRLGEELDAVRLDAARTEAERLRLATECEALSGTAAKRTAEAALLVEELAEARRQLSYTGSVRGAALNLGRAMKRRYFRR